MASRLDYLQKLCEQIILLGDSHVEYHFLTPAGKIVHIFRTVPTHRINKWIAHFTLRSSFNQLVWYTHGWMLMLMLELIVHSLHHF